MRRRAAARFWLPLLLLSLGLPHGAHGAHRAVEMVICGGAAPVTLWLPAPDAAAQGHGVDCCLIHAALAPPAAPRPGLSRARARRRRPDAPGAVGRAAPPRRARGPPRRS